jgi:hypothetical protein
MPSGGDKGGAGDDEYALDVDSDEEEQDKMDEDAAADEMAKGVPNPVNAAPNGQRIPALDEEHEYEWKWKVSLAVMMTHGEAGADPAAQDGGFAPDFLPLELFYVFAFCFGVLHIMFASICA